jgi:hypothetical protein
MDSSRLFRRALASRFVHLVAIGAAPSLGFIACGGDVVTTSGPSGTSSASSAGGQGQGGAGGQGQGGAAPTMPVKACIPLDETDPNGCPTAADAPPKLPGNICGMSPGVESGPVLDSSTNQCCYMIIPVDDTSCGVGRPFLVAARALHATAVAGPAWHARESESEGSAPAVADLAADVRAELARAWTNDALLEHASVASFGRFALELLAVGAPPDLVEAAHRAALDEIRHARLCFALAGAYAGAPIAPSAFPFGGAIEVSSDLAVVAANTAREGCIGETLAAVQAAEQLGQATDPAVRAALAIIAADEARHAELAWRAVAWAVATGGAPVRDAVAQVFASAEGVLAVFTVAAPVGSEALTAHGRLGGVELTAALRRALDEVVRPAAAALLATEAPAQARGDALSCNEMV